MQLKDMQTQTNLPDAPRLEKGMKFKSITSIATFNNRFNAIHVNATEVNGTAKMYRTSAKAIVDFLTDHFVKKGSTESIENAEVVELRSKEGRMYLALKGF